MPVDRVLTSKKCPFISEGVDYSPKKETENEDHNR